MNSNNKEYVVYSCTKQNTHPFRVGNLNYKGKELFYMFMGEYGDMTADRDSRKTFDNEKDARTYFDTCKPYTFYNGHYTEVKGWFYEENLLDEDGEFIEMIGGDEKFHDLITFPYCVREKDSEDIIEVYKYLDDARKGLIEKEDDDKRIGVYEPNSYEIAEFDPEIWDYDVFHEYEIPNTGDEAMIKAFKEDYMEGELESPEEPEIDNDIDI